MPSRAQAGWAWWGLSSHMLLLIFCWIFVWQLGFQYISSWDDNYLGSISKWLIYSKINTNKKLFFEHWSLKGGWQNGSNGQPAPWATSDPVENWENLICYSKCVDTKAFPVRAQWSPSGWLRVSLRWFFFNQEHRMVLQAFLLSLFPGAQQLWIQSWFWHDNLEGMHFTLVFSCRKFTVSWGSPSERRW